VLFYIAGYVARIILELLLREVGPASGGIDSFEEKNEKMAGASRVVAALSDGILTSVENAQKEGMPCDLIVGRSQA
jgi:hypothetical protein